MKPKKATKSASKQLKQRLYNVQRTLRSLMQEAIRHGI